MLLFFEIRFDEVSSQTTSEKKGFRVAATSGHHSGTDQRATWAPSTDLKF